MVPRHLPQLKVSAMNMNELELATMKAYAPYWRNQGFHKWPKAAGSELTASHLLAAEGLITGRSPRARTGTVQVLAIAMYLRPDGASNGQVFVATACAESKQNVRISLDTGHKGAGGSKYLITRRDGSAYVCEVTPKGQKVIDAYIASKLAGEAPKPVKAKGGKAKPRKAKAAKVAPVEVTEAPAEAPVDQQPQG